MTKRKSDPEGCENQHTPALPAVLRFGGLSRSRSSTGNGTPTSRGFKKPRILSDSSTPLRDVSANTNITAKATFQTNSNSPASVSFFTPTSSKSITHPPNARLDINSNVSLVNGQANDLKKGPPIFVSAGSKEPIVLTSEIGKITARSLNCWLDCLKDSDEDNDHEMPGIQDISNVPKKNDDEDQIDPEADDYLASLDLSTLF